MQLSYRGTRFILLPFDSSLCAVLSATLRYDCLTAAVFFKICCGQDFLSARETR